MAWLKFWKNIVHGGTITIQARNRVGTLRMERAFFNPYKFVAFKHRHAKSLGILYFCKSQKTRRLLCLKALDNAPDVI